jgi:hypothetical protein
MAIIVSNLLRHQKTLDHNIAGGHSRWGDTGICTGALYRLTAVWPRSVSFLFNLTVFHMSVILLWFVH